MVTPPPIELGSLGMADSLILMVLALVVFGPRRLPQIGRQIGKLMYEFRKASNDFKFQMEEELRLSEDDDRRKKDEAERQKVAALAAPATVEAQADIGAVEPATAEAVVAGEPSPYPGEGVYPPIVDAAPEPDVVILPRVAPVIQPPSTGEPIPAARYGARPLAPEITEGPEAGEVSSGPAAEEANGAITPTDPQTEPTRQHG